MSKDISPRADGRVGPRLSERDALEGQRRGSQGVGVPRAAASTRGARGDRDRPGGKRGDQSLDCLLSAVSPPCAGIAAPSRAGRSSWGYPAGTGGLEGTAEVEAVSGHLWEGGLGYGSWRRTVVSISAPRLVSQDASQA